MDDQKVIFDEKPIIRNHPQAVETLSGLTAILLKYKIVDTQKKAAILFMSVIAACLLGVIIMSQHFFSNPNKPIPKKDRPVGGDISRPN